MEYEESLIIKTAWYYYLENMTQQRIAEILGISRIRVIKLLEKARQTGVIQFKVRRDSASRMVLEKALCQKYNLKDSFVVPTNPEEEGVNETVAKAAAMYIGNRIDSNDYINIGYGDTPSRVLNNLAMMSEKPITCISLTGGVNYYLPNTHSQTFNARLFLMPAPLIASSGALADAMRQEASVTEISRMAMLSAITVVGIGGMSENATIFKSNILSKNDMYYLKMQGAVGDILSHFLDENGNLLTNDVEDRLISTSLDTIKNLDNVIGVAAGDAKIPAIRAVLLGAYLDVLITDENTAQQLLKEE